MPACPLAASHSFSKQDAEKFRQRMKTVVWFVLFIWFLWVKQQNKPVRPDQPDEPRRFFRSLPN
jgi:hypothetical protein